MNAETTPAAPLPFALYDHTAQTWLVAAGVGFFFVMAAVAWLGWWYSQRRTYRHSPYSIFPLRYSTDLSYSAIGKVYLYLNRLRQYDNRMFDIRRAVVCSETGRIFPDAINWFGRVNLDWGFLQKRRPGNYVSWGSLTERQKEALRAVHPSLEGFQTKIVSTAASPRAAEPEVALAKPGPLYVDIDSAVLLGWKEVPGTELEVLIVQLPKKR